MTVVYLDAFLVLNFVVNYLLLACAGKLDGEPVGRGRTALAAALGAAYGGLALLPDWGFWSTRSARPARRCLCSWRPLVGRSGCCGQGRCSWCSPVPSGGRCCWWPWSGGDPGTGGCWGPLWGCGASSLRRL
ncbi:MAG: sigma-E processing peptidase SpoIIGA [Evtepia gabavorous]